MARIEKHTEVGFFLSPEAYALAHVAYAVVAFKEPPSVGNSAVTPPRSN